MVRGWIFALMGWLFLSSAFGENAKIDPRLDALTNVIQKALITESKVYLYSIKPHALGPAQTNNANNTFCDNKVLGMAEIKPLLEKTNLLTSLANGIVNAPHFAMLCFNPRHGVRIVNGTATNDFLICFECAKGYWCGSNSMEFHISGGPEPVFDQFLKEYKLQKAK